MTAGSTAPSPYASREYAASLAHIGEPVHLAHSDTWLLARPIAGTDRRDLTGPYPLLSPGSTDPAALRRDLEALGGAGFVSMAAVVDPIAGLTESELRGAFPDHVAAFKPHYLVDLDRPVAESASKHHLRYLRVGLRNSSVTRVEQDPEAWGDWCALYRVLVERHGITGAAAFGETAFRALRDVPGVRLYAARKDGVTLSMQVWFVAGERAWYHLAASSDEGYAARAAHACMASALDDLRADGVRVAHLGGGAGTAAKEDGLTRYKAGWSTRSETAYIAGAILDPAGYAELSGNDAPDGFFPAYRAPRG